MAPRVRPTAVLIEDGQILLVEEHVSGDRGWSLPGGRLEVGETLEHCLMREVEEETGLVVALDRLLYICDRLEEGASVIHITFAVTRTAGHLRTSGKAEPGVPRSRRVKMVPLSELTDYGFSERFRQLAEANFPGSGTYEGPVSRIGL